MKKILYLFIIIMSFFSCTRKKNVLYFYNEVNRDTIIGVKLFLGEDRISPEARIIFRDSIYQEQQIKDSLINLGLLDLLKQEMDAFSCNFLLYVNKGSFSDFSLYNDTNFYLKGYINFPKEADLPFVFISLRENNYRKANLVKDKQMKDAIQDSINQYLRDSIAKILRQKEIVLSFMEYEIGKSYSKSRKRPTAEEHFWGRDLLGMKVSSINAYHYDDIIYKIEVKMEGYSTDFDKVLELYKTKYGLGYLERKWIFKNGEIDIDWENWPRGRRGARIIYVDYKLDSIATKGIYNDSLKNAVRLNKQKEQKFKQALPII